MTDATGKVKEICREFVIYLHNDDGMTLDEAFDQWLQTPPAKSLIGELVQLSALQGKGEGGKVGGRVFKWYYTEKNEFPKHKERIQFDDNNNILHLGTFYKKDQFGRDNVFVSTEGAHFESSQVPAWIPIFWKDKALTTLPPANQTTEVPINRLISMVERRMKKAGILDILIDRLPEDKYRDLIYNFFESLREVD